MFGGYPDFKTLEEAINVQNPDMTDESLEQLRDNFSQANSFYEKAKTSVEILSGMV